jgi:hypothetical protein
MFYYVRLDGALLIVLCSTLIGAKGYMVLACGIWMGKQIMWKEDTYNMKTEKGKWRELD